MPIIELHQVERRYTTAPGSAPVLHGLELSIEPGEFVAIVGPSGCGKSTLLHLVGGLDKPNRGSVRVEGRELGQASPGELDEHRRTVVGFVFQAFHLNPRRTALENVVLPLVFAPLEGVDERSWGRELLRQVGLEGLEERPAGSLSGGQRQRVAVARALVRKPRILLADEPVGNLDADTGRELVALLRRLNLDLGVTILAVCHDHMLLEAATRTLYLREGVLHEAHHDNSEEGPAPGVRQVRRLPQGRPELGSEDAE